MKDVNINDLKISEAEKNKLLIKNVNNRPNALATYGQAKKSSKDVKDLFDQQFIFVSNRFNELCEGVTAEFLSITVQSENQIGRIDEALDRIIEIQNSLIGGKAV